MAISTQPERSVGRWPSNKLVLTSQSKQPRPATSTSYLLSAHRTANTVQLRQKYPRWDFTLDPEEPFISQMWQRDDLASPIRRRQRKNTMRNSKSAPIFETLNSLQDVTARRPSTVGSTLSLRQPSTNVTKVNRLRQCPYCMVLYRESHHDCVVFQKNRTRPATSAYAPVQNEHQRPKSTAGDALFHVRTSYQHREANTGCSNSNVLSR